MPKILGLSVISIALCPSSLILSPSSSEPISKSFFFLHRCPCLWKGLLIVIATSYISIWLVATLRLYHAIKIGHGLLTAFDTRGRLGIHTGSGAPRHADAEKHMRWRLFCHTVLSVLSAIREYWSWRHRHRGESGRNLSSLLLCFPKSQDSGRNPSKQGLSTCVHEVEPGPTEEEGPRTAPCPRGVQRAALEAVKGLHIP
jgi:hypothetical protein